MPVTKKHNVGDRESKSYSERARDLFASTPRLLEYYHLSTASPCCKIKLAIWDADKEEWRLPKEVKFPVVAYDLHGNMVVAKDESELSRSLGRRTSFEQVELFQVPVGSRFAWVEFEKGKKPSLVRAQQGAVKELDWDLIGRIDKINQLFFWDGLERFRLHFAVGTSGNFKLMGGVVCGY